MLGSHSVSLPACSIGQSKAQSSIYSRRREVVIHMFREGSKLLVGISAENCPWLISRKLLFERV
jgi:hypothetical protein